VIGTVASYDSPRGWGEIEATDGRRYPFHCTAIADGSREIGVGLAVGFELRPGHLGRFEAIAVTPG
jgi:cold shock CspA family protein